ncbi:MAG: hypothetical protein GX845_01645 [Erysipelothrix sp.]|nr:hypothetical protein [Erysipelothrix sp.]
MESLTIKRRDKAGYMLVELLLVLFVVALFSQVGVRMINLNKQFWIKDEVLKLEIENTQLKAIQSMSRVKLPFLVDHVQLTYNAFGNINQAQHGKLSYPYHQEITFFLGYGRYEIH